MSVCRQSLNLLRKTFVQYAPVINRTDIRTMKRWVAPTLRELKLRRIKAGPEPVVPRSSYLEWNYDAELFAFGKRLSEELNRDVLKRALTHRSYAIQQELKQQEESGEIKTTLPDNRELIKKGEEIISNCIYSTLQDKYPEVVVKSVYNYLTTESMLSYVASHIGLKDIVLCADFPVEDRTLAQSFKAIVATVEESSNTERAELFVKDFLLSQLNGKDLYELWDPQNPYGYLENLLKEKGYPEMEPRLCNQSAINTILSNYQVGLYCNKKLIGIGWGESIDIAKETAAFDAIKNVYTNRI